MTVVFLIRHGESQSNAGQATTDPENIELTSRGREQARRIAHYLASCAPIDLIVTSPYLRAKQTARMTTAMRPFGSVTQKEWNVQEFTYLASMHQEHLTFEQRKPRVDEYWERYDPTYIDSPGSESFLQFIERAQEFMTLLRTVPYENIAVFSHEQFINAVIWLIKRTPVEISPQTMQDFHEFLGQHHLRNGTVIRLKVQSTPDNWRYQTIVDHLEPEGMAFKLNSASMAARH